MHKIPNHTSHFVFVLSQGTLYFWEWSVLLEYSSKFIASER